MTVIIAHFLSLLLDSSFNKHFHLTSLFLSRRRIADDTSIFRRVEIFVTRMYLYQRDESFMQYRITKRNSIKSKHWFCYRCRQHRRCRRCRWRASWLTKAAITIHYYHDTYEYMPPYARAALWKSYTRHVSGLSRPRCYSTAWIR